jgi:hypothetical protein
MMQEQENQNDENELNPPTGKGSFNRVLAILFVLAIYMVIFLKILFIQ